MHQILIKGISSCALFAISFLFCCSTANNPQGPKTVRANDSFDEAVADVLRTTNVQRQQRRLEPLKKDERLMKAAQDYAQLMAKKDKLTHTVAGQRLAARVERAQYQWLAIAENIAENQVLNGQDVVVQQWMKSSGHRGNILGKDFTHIGIGIAGPNKSNRYYYCQIFARPK